MKRENECTHFVLDHHLPSLYYCVYSWMNIHPPLFFDVLCLIYFYINVDFPLVTSVLCASVPFTELLLCCYWCGYCLPTNYRTRERFFTCYHPTKLSVFPLVSYMHEHASYYYFLLRYEDFVYQQIIMTYHQQWW